MRRIATLVLCSASILLAQESPRQDYTLVLQYTTYGRTGEPNDVSERRISFRADGAKAFRHGNLDPARPFPVVRHMIDPSRGLRTVYYESLRAKKVVPLVGNACQDSLWKEPTCKGFDSLENHVGTRVKFGLTLEEFERRNGNYHKRLSRAPALGCASVELDHVEITAVKRYLRQSVELVSAHAGADPELFDDDEEAALITDDKQYGRMVSEFLKKQFPR